MSDGPLPYKRDVANQLLRKGSLFIHLDPRVHDVIVPPWLKHQAQLVLQVGLDMPIPIPDLRVDEDGIFGTLSFSRTPFACNVPWNAVFALVGDEGRGMVWPESMPAEIVAEVERETQRAKLSKESHESRGAVTRTREGGADVLRWPGRTEDSRKDSNKDSIKDTVVPVLRAAEPNSRIRRDSSRPGSGSARTSARRSGKALPPYLRVVK
jgi:Stringent starvation protein B